MDFHLVISAYCLKWLISTKEDSWWIFAAATGVGKSKASFPRSFTVKPGCHWDVRSSRNNGTSGQLTSYSFFPFSSDFWRLCLHKRKGKSKAKIWCGMTKEFCWSTFLFFKIVNSRKLLHSSYSFCLILHPFGVAFFVWSSNAPNFCSK